MKEAVHKILKIEAIISLFTSGFLNALCAWLINQKSAYVDVHMWSIMFDLFITAHCTCILTVLFAHFSSKRYIRMGVFTKCRTISGFAKNPILLGFLMGDLSFLTGFIIINSLFAILSISALSLCGYIVYKWIFGAAVGILANNIALQRFMLAEK